MSLVSIRWLSVICLLAAGGCVKTNNVENDNRVLGKKDPGDTTSGDAGSDADSGASGDAGGSPATHDDAGDDGDAGDDDGGRGSIADGDSGAPVSLPDGGMSDEKDSGSSVPVVKIAGSAPLNHCGSTTPPANGMCSSHFCGITAAQLATAMDPNSPCGTPAQACEQGAKVGAKVTDCSVSLKSKNPFSSNAQLRPKVQACVYEDAQIKQDVNTTCLGCFLDVAECAGDKCLNECLFGTAKQCDTCRIANGCEQPLFQCAGLPNPL